jgi:aminobenzoyl-glutamate utilization protein B
MPSIIEKSYSKYDSDLRRISLEIHKYRELAFDEHKSVRLLVAFLESQGFVVERGIAGDETAFVGTYGDGTVPIVSFNAVY